MRPVVGVMGQGEDASSEECALAYDIGRLLAEAGWVVLSGGRRSGVMDAVSRGARAGGGFVVGVLPGHDRAQASEALDLAIVTGIGEARNNVNILSSDVVVACGEPGPGTLSEIALALKARRPIVLCGASETTVRYLRGLSDGIVATDDAAATVAVVRRLLPS